MALLIALIAALGTFWLYTATALGWRGIGFGPQISEHRNSKRFDLSVWLRQAGLEDVNARQFLAVIALFFVAAALVGYVIFGGAVPSITLAVFAASFPVTSFRARRRNRCIRAQEAWPRIIEEIRLQTGSMGRSIPNALLDVGRRGPAETRSAFEAAHREWLLTTDFVRTTSLLKEHLADPSADMACETLMVAYELGGHELDRRLEALAEDRLQDIQGRKDARSRQAGARFARIFVLLVPLGMALAGVSIGSGRDAYQTSTGQAVVVTALLLMMACWFWAGQIMRLPEPKRVFSR